MGKWVLFVNGILFFCNFEITLLISFQPQLVCVCVCSVVSGSSRPHGRQPVRLLCPWDFPGKNAGVDCHFLLQEIFPTKGSYPHLWWFSGKESTCQYRRRGFDLWLGKISWRRKWQSTPVFLPENLKDRGAWRTTVPRVTESQT